MNGWVYDAGEKPKKRHHWDKPFSGFIEIDGLRVSKCPGDMTTSEAQRLLDEAIPYSKPSWRYDHPNRLYTVASDGTVYRAKPTVPGKSYHGFPEDPAMLPPDRRLRKSIMERAVRLGCETQVSRWLRKGKLR